MALTRRDFLIAAPVLTGALVACSSHQLRPVLPSYQEIGSTNARDPAAKTIVVFMPQTPQTRDVYAGLSDELAGAHRLVAVRLEQASEVTLIEQAMERHHPSGLVLVNNPTVAAYREFQRRHAGSAFPPAVIVMSSFLEDPSRQLVNAIGISYEIPLVMLMTDLRKVIALPAERVGVVVRPALLRFVNRQIELARREQVLVSVEQVSNSPRPPEVMRAIRRLKQHVDVIWVLNDDQLLTQHLITKGWLPGLNERPRIPTIVAVASLVSPRCSFGTFAILPDHVVLGAQVASLLLDIAEADWTVSSVTPLQLPRSTTSTIDLAQIRERFTLQANALNKVDRALE